MLEIKDLTVSVAGRKIIENLSLSLAGHDTMVLFGPNGSGKSTLIKAIMGFGGYTVEKGDILFNGTRLNGLAVEERVKLGIGMMYQNPPEVHGVRLHHIAEKLETEAGIRDDLAARLNVSEYMQRDINVGFSGGERKRSELYQMLLMKPRLLLMDEPESGVDIENIRMMGEILNDYIKREQPAVFIITHTGYILDYVSGHNACIMFGGRIYCLRDARNVFETIKKYGYERCKECTVHSIAGEYHERT